MVEDSVDGRTAHAVRWLVVDARRCPDSDIVRSELRAWNFENDGHHIEAREEVGSGTAGAEGEAIPEGEQIEEKRVVKETSAQAAAAFDRDSRARLASGKDRALVAAGRRRDAAKLNVLRGAAPLEAQAIRNVRSRVAVPIDVEPVVGARPVGCGAQHAGHWIRGHYQHRICRVAGRLKRIDVVDVDAAIGLDEGSVEVVGRAGQARCDAGGEHYDSRYEGRGT